MSTLAALDQAKEHRLSEAITALRHMGETPLWRHFCLRLRDLLVLSRDELEQCDTEQEMWITQGGIRMLRKLIEWDAELKDDIQKQIMLEESGDADGRDGTEYSE